MSRPRIQDLYPLSPVQQGLLFHALEAPEPGMYLSQWLAPLEGAVDEEALRQALQQVLDRHTVLRTAFNWERREEPFQIVYSEVELPWRSEDWRALDADAQERRLEELLAEDRIQDFELRRPPLLRVTLVRTGEDRGHLLWTHHHLLLDGWSLPLLFAEVGRLYAGLRRGQPVRLPPAPAFGEYVKWLQRRSAAAEEEFWREHLAGLSEATLIQPVLTPPTAGPRQLEPGTPHGTLDDALPVPVASALEALVRRHKVTLNTVLQGAWAVLLGRYTNRSEVLFGTTVTDRPAEVPGIETMVGVFINTLPLRLRIAHRSPAASWLAGVQELHAALREHQATPLAKLREHAQVAPGELLFDHIVVVENVPAAAAAEAEERGTGGAGAVSEGLPLGSPHTVESINYPLAVVAWPGHPPTLRLLYRPELFDRATLQRLLGHFKQLLGELGEGPEAPLETLSLLTPAERWQLTGEWQTLQVGSQAEPLDVPVHRRFVAQARQRPEAVAVVDGDRHCTYGELDRSSELLAKALRSQGVGLGARVGLCLPSSSEMVTAILAVVRAGGAYVPLDPDYPQDRLAFTVADAGLTALLTNAGLRERMVSLLEAPGEGTAEVPVLVLEEIAAGDGCTGRLAAGIGAEEAGVDGEELPDGPCPSWAPAYVIYTSGSTGRPKGVVVSHGNLGRLFAVTRAELGFDAGDVWSLCHSFAFDFSVWEMWGALVHGARLVLVPTAARRSPDELHRILVRDRVTVLSQTPSAFRQLALFDHRQEPREALALRLVVFGGEALAPQDLASWMQDHGDRAPRLLNMYGITETTVHVTWRTMVRGDLRTPAASLVGRPLPDLRVQLMDPRRRPVPVGVAGEILVGGAGVSAGYHGRPALTAQRFVPAAGGQRLYRSGDLARWTAAGELEYLGRLDDQVQLRGYRIELGEVTSRIQELPGVLDSVVLLIRRSRDDARLVAFYIAAPDGPREALSPAGLREQLAGVLPQPMIPGQLVPVDAFPLTPTGKLDRRRLEALASTDGAPAAALRLPRSPLERELAELWQEVLAVPREVGLDDDFFELGGHSLLAMKLVARMGRALGVQTGVRELLENPTLEAFAAGVEERRRGDDGRPAAIPRAPRDLPLPLSFAQQRMWFLDQLDPGSPLYNLAVPLSFEGPLEVRPLARAFEAVERRHEILRTVFPALEGKPVQEVGPPRRRPLPWVNLSRLGPLAEAEAQRLAEADARRGFDLATGPLWRKALLQLAADRWVALVTLHHIVSDGWSMELLMRELGTLYFDAVAGRRPSLPELSIQYADFAVWQRRFLEPEVLRRQEEYWRRHLDPEWEPELMPDRSAAGRGAAGRGGGAGAELFFELDPASVEGLRRLLRRQGITAFTGWTALLMAWLEKLGGRSTVRLGSPIAGRHYPGVEPLVGFFVNTLVLQQDLSEGPSFRRLLDGVRQTVLEAYDHQDLPFERLVESLGVERQADRTPLFQVMFSYHRPRATAVELPGLRLTSLKTPATVAKFDLEIDLVDRGETVAGRLEYKTARFDEATAERWLGYLRQLLAAVVAEPEVSLHRVSWLGDSERRQLLNEWAGNVAPELPATSVHQAFEAMAARHPEATALVAGEVRWSYRELRRRARAVAASLVEQGLEAEAPVALLAHRSPHLVAGMLGVLMAGGVYVPLDPSLPAPRLSFLLQDSGARTMLVQGELKARLEEQLADSPADLQTLSSIRELPLAATGDGQPLPPGGAVDPRRLCYLMYTSGSTGEPKGVAVPHGAVLRLVLAGGPIRFGPEQRWLHFAPASFDAATLEVWGPLLHGGRLVLPEQPKPSLRHLASTLEQQEVTCLWLTAALFHQMVDEEAASLSGLQQLLAGGDVLSVPHVLELRRRAPKLRLINGYGPTENTTFTCCHVVEAASTVTSVPIGRPIPGTSVVVQDAFGGLTPVGAPGELYAGGAGLARGYAGRPALTASSFVPNPWGEAGSRLYRTGDRVRWRGDGRLEFLGRRDGQVKIRGFRIELGEVEAALRRQPGVVDAAVVTRPDPGGGLRIVGYYTAGQEPVSPAVLTERLRQQLPAYMVPTVLTSLEALPLTATGKLDRRNLPEAEDSEAQGGELRGPVEELVATAFRSVLGLDGVGREEDFFELGGHSLLATQLAARVRDLFAVDLSLVDVFEGPTVAAIAAAVDEARRRGAPPLEAVSADETGAGEDGAPGAPQPLSFAQESIWFVDHLDPGNPAFNIPVALRLQGELRPALLAQALARVVERHGVLRTRFELGPEGPVQVVQEAFDPGLPLIDLQALPAAQRETAGLEVLAAASALRFDLRSPPLLRGALLRVGPREHVLALVIHHIVADGWSLGVVFRELGQAYTDLDAGRPVDLPELPLQYADYSRWQRRWLRGDTLEELVSFWQRALEGATQPLQLPTDRPRQPGRSFPRGERALNLGSGLSQSLELLGREAGATPFMVLQAVVGVLLGGISGQREIVVGSPVAGRTRSELEGLVGCFLNTLVLRTSLGEELTVVQLLQQVRRTTLDAYHHQELPYERLVSRLAGEREAGDAQLYRVWLVLQNTPMPMAALPSLDIRPVDVPVANTKFDLAFNLAPTQEGIQGVLEYRSDLFNPATADALAETFLHLATQLAESPEASVGTLLQRVQETWRARTQAQEQELQSSLRSRLKGARRKGVSV